eukprot:364600-Chlamydomonas_euryale.AAC.13
MVVARVRLGNMLLKQVSTGTRRSFLGPYMRWREYTFKVCFLMPAVMAAATMTGWSSADKEVSRSSADKVGFRSSADKVGFRYSADKVGFRYSADKVGLRYSADEVYLRRVDRSKSAS